MIYFFSHSVLSVDSLSEVDQLSVYYTLKNFFIEIRKVLNAFRPKLLTRLTLSLFPYEQPSFAQTYLHFMVKFRP